ncbi:hypothetical protein GCM10010507_17290 [Streptomyces cinnamoneus]|uniref:Uncharacterized protein n=1 Tax=Streptomyces cinnamoneus TaxID=53446 RepID=A0A918WF94_STRCJ|nr:hypothetical protein GCM10010507_17290 [Streptomyces cinnamoneus]
MVGRNKGRKTQHPAQYEAPDHGGTTGGFASASGLSQPHIENVSPVRPLGQAELGQSAGNVRSRGPARPGVGTERDGGRESVGFLLPRQQHISLFPLQYQEFRVRA